MKVKAYFLFLFISAFPALVFSQVKDSAAEKENEGYKFTVKKEINSTPVKDQYRSGTCWSFSSNSMIENELIRLGKGEFDLSEMWVVRKCYEDKAIKYVRMHGAFNFGGGGALNDVLEVIKKYGLVPESAYPGLNYGEEKHVHGEMDGALKAFLDDIIQNKNKTLSSGWFEAFKGILDGYLGKEPESFEYNGKKYTPRTFTDNVLGLNPDDYVAFSSYTHHPFYSKFILEVPDNWTWNAFNNVPMDEMIQIIDNAVNNGFTIAWAGDISEKGFSWKNGVAVVPEENFENISGLERAKWDELSQKEKDKLIYSFDKPAKEKAITQEMRQKGFDNYSTTDDHGMQITGIAEDQNGTKYYLVKNSWDIKGNDYEGYLYMSETFIRYKTMSMMVHKDAVPKEIAKKIGMK